MSVACFPEISHATWAQYPRFQLRLHCGESRWRNTTPKRGRLVLRGQRPWFSPTLLGVAIAIDPFQVVYTSWLKSQQTVDLWTWHFSNITWVDITTYIKNTSNIKQYLESPKLNLWNHLSPTLYKKNKHPKKEAQTLPNFWENDSPTPNYRKTSFTAIPQRQLPPHSVTSWLSRSLRSDLPTRPPRHGRELHMLTGFCFFFGGRPQTTIFQIWFGLVHPKKTDTFVQVFGLRVCPLQLSLLKSYKNIQKSLYDQPKLNVLLWT